MRIEIMIDKEQKISQGILTALEAELYKNLLPVYPKTNIRIRKGTANGVELSGLKLDAEKKNVMDILQSVWEDDSWQH
ncbi:DinI-like family protein [Pantoea sp. Cy-640]|uniref:DinI-like family protein n=1 Tax=Pantoea sp. Cy-640 TaxID=2608353 RepID=UPI0014193270|nr:DinI-like family protein [Pantoea sp. Cy-640]NIG15841.1 DinI family protein [Pantoea sp. Cy-640]